VDVLCLNYEGNVVDAALIAAVAALDDVILPQVNPVQELNDEVTIPIHQGKLDRQHYLRRSTTHKLMCGAPLICLNETQHLPRDSAYFVIRYHSPVASLRVIPSMIYQFLKKTSWWIRSLLSWMNTSR